MFDDRVRKHNNKLAKTIFPYKNEHGIIPECEFCNNPCSFGSIFTKNFLTHCNKGICAKRAVKRGLFTKIAKRIKYDMFINQHKEFYKNVTIPFDDICDIFDNNKITNLKKFKSRSYSLLECLNEKKTCIYCKQEYIFNKFNNNIDRCNSLSCRSINKLKYHDEYINYQEIPFNLFLLNKKRKTFSNDMLRDLYKNYSQEIIIGMIKNHIILYNGILLKRNSSKDNFSFIYNKIYDEDMFNACVICGASYIKYDKIIVDGKLLYKKVNRCGEFTCGRKDCYFESMRKGFYPYKESSKEKQSLSLKKKIKDGLFTPKSNNSWTNNKTNLIHDNIKFRSTWELYFYLYCKNNNIKVEYETKRIPYIDTTKNKQRIYIVDFYIPGTSTYVEVKPKCHQKSQVFADKMQALEKYCEENNGKIQIIDEFWLKLCYNISYTNELDNSLKLNVQRLLKEYEKPYEG